MKQSTIMPATLPNFCEAWKWKCGPLLRIKTANGISCDTPEQTTTMKVEYMTLDVANPKWIFGTRQRSEFCALFSENLTRNANRNGKDMGKEQIHVILNSWKCRQLQFMNSQTEENVLCTISRCSKGG